MKSIPILRLVLSLAGGAFVTGCSPSQAPRATPADVAYYTCTMHPSVRSEDPDGKCPICGMDLVPVKKADAPSAPGAGAEADGPHEFTIPLERQQLFGVTFAPVETRRLRRTVRALGLVAAATGRQWVVVSHVDGYVHELQVFAPGDPVKKGQALLDLYSPDLVATENEYLDLLRLRATSHRDQNVAAEENAAHLLSGARARLRQWEISEAQIEAMEKTGTAERDLELTSPVGGVVESIAVGQGRHVAAGEALVSVADLSAVWVWAEFYESELPLLRPALPVTLTSSAFPNRSIPGKIAVVDPFLDPVKRTVRVRIDVANPDLQLRPGADVGVALELDGGEGLTVPFEAVLPTGSHNLVFVDRGSGRLEPRFVELGGRFGEVYQVTGGLRAGERVVRSANFLVDAEAQVQGALKILVKPSLS